MRNECARENEVLAAVNTGRWQAGRADAELQAHVAGCRVCQDTATVAAAFANVDAGAQALPDASAVWLRSQIRARGEAARLAQQPITVAQALAFASVVGVLGALLGASSSWLQAALSWTLTAMARLDPRSVPLPAGLGALATEHVGIAAAIALAIMLAPVAVYWAIREN